MNPTEGYKFPFDGVLVRWNEGEMQPVGAWGAKQPREDGPVQVRWSNEFGRVVGGWKAKR